MSQIGNTGGPTPRRSNRLSTKASSVAAESAVTQMTSGGTRLRRKGPLTKVKARKSNAYGASGRVGAAEELSVSATGFAQAFQNQRGDAFARDEEEEEEDDDIDELGEEGHLMSGALNGNTHRHLSSPAPVVPSRAAPGLSFVDSDDITPSEDELAASVGNTSKSFGMDHEGGMLFQYDRQEMRFSPQRDSELTPLLEKSAARRTFQSRIHTQAKAPAQPRAQSQSQSQARATPQQPPTPVIRNDRNEIEQSVDDLIAEEQARMQKERHPQLQPWQRSGGYQKSPTRPRVVDQWLGNVEPPQVDDAEWPWKKYLMWAFWVIMASLVLGMLSTTLFPSKSPESAPQAPGMTMALASRISYQWGKLAEFISPPGPPPELSEEEQFRKFTGGDDDVMWERMSKLNNKFDTRINDVQSAIEGLKNELPPFMIVRKHKDGHLEITDQFWHALVSKTRSNGDSVEWNELMKQITLKVKGISGVVPGDSTTSWDQIVSREEFVATMAELRNTFHTGVDEKISKAIRAQTDQITAVAQAEARKTMLDNIRLQSLAQANLLANYELHLRKPNYFSLGLGAVVEPTMTSATFTNIPSRYVKFLRWLAPDPQRNPPAAALSDWKNLGDCWCSAPNAGKGQAQLVVSLSRPMTPKQVTIEHVPMSMVPAGDISDAPRDVELWVQTDAPVKVRYSYGQSEYQGGPPGWQCLGTFKYNIHASNHLQTFDLDSEPSVPITKAMVRVRTNWGADHTCLYQVRLHGDDAVEDHEYGVGLNDPI
ncbi:SAD1 protein [Cucurbitaria berberidis CBS 394.84]|uniref:SAD1 protein n=1 Tax=Cucurbitaria berberidis CBS 394.84 TaxID=1168544 RepID=A0A9P4L9X4_9PLEO|nr:SAD1 protein [Cucurbitaria berberidis CBS 394.84]KAF1846649.1 SAD1 protein [Cucurbitaria berberidis CBS 394.84]